MRPYTNANARYIFAMKALCSHTDAIECPEINFQLASRLDGLCIWLYHGHGKAEE